MDASYPFGAVETGIASINTNATRAVSLVRLLHA